MKTETLAKVIDEIEKMIDVHRKVESNTLKGTRNVKRNYHQYFDLLIEQTDFSFEDKDNLREYFRRSIR